MILWVLICISKMQHLRWLKSTAPGIATRLTTINYCGIFYESMDGLIVIASGEKERSSNTHFAQSPRIHKAQETYPKLKSKPKLGRIYGLPAKWVLGERSVRSVAFVLMMSSRNCRGMSGKGLGKWELGKPFILLYHRK